MTFSLCYRLRYEDRAALAKNPLGARLFELMARKRTNLSVAADVQTADDMLALADAVGPHVCVLKTHVDVFDTWTEDHANKLRELADKHGEVLGLGLGYATLMPCFPIIFAL